MLPVTHYFNTNGTYITPATCKYIKVFFCGGGGGGGGGSVLTVYGGGGSAGMAVLKYYPPNTYSYTIGVGGLGGAINVAGSDGTATIFDTLGVFILAAAQKGLGGTIIPPQFGSSTSTETSASGIRLALIKSQAGADDTIDVSGNGGMNSLNSNGMGAYTTGASQNATQGERGSGGGGGCGSTGIGGNGTDGFVRITEYY